MPADLKTMAEIQQNLLGPVWPVGRNPQAPWDGRHYTLKGYERPVSVSTGEAFVLASCVRLSAAEFAFEIGTGFGYSSAWLALGFAHRATGGEIVSLDDFSEGGLGAEGLAAAKEIATRLGIDGFTQFVVGESPGDVAATVGNRAVDIAFVDAAHHGDQPIRDYLAVLAHLTPSSLLLFHDVDPARYTVHEAVALAERDGWTCRRLSTSCHLTAAFKARSWADIVDEALRCARRGVIAGD